MHFYVNNGHQNEKEKRKKAKTDQSKYLLLAKDANNRQMKIKSEGKKEKKIKPGLR